MGAPRRHRVGEPRLPRLRDDGHRGQPRPALLLAGRPRRGGGPPDLARPPLPARRHHDLQRVRRLRPPRPHPDPRRRASGRSSGPATRPGTRSSSTGPGSSRGRRRSSTSRRSRPRSASGWPSGWRSSASEPFWAPPEDATPEQIAEFEAFAAKMLVPDESITTWIDISRRAARGQVGRHPRARDPDQRRTARSCSSASTAGGRAGRSEAYILRESRVESSIPETDLFAGIV